MKGKRFKSINEKCSEKNKILITVPWIYWGKTTLLPRLEYESEADTYVAKKIAHQCLCHRKT